MLPWAEMWRAALHAGVSPQAFWQLSVREWRWLSGPYGAGLDRAGLRGLMQIFLIGASRRTRQMEARMDEFEQSLDAASDALNGLVDGPGVAAAAALEQAFGKAGKSIEQALSQAARSGELDFRRMAESVLAELARIAAEAVLSRSGLAQGAGQTVNLNMALGAGADAGSIVGATGSIANLVAMAAARGGRFT